MFKIIGWCFKAAAFAALILVAGQLIRWDGKTISDQVKTGLSKAERAAPVKAAKRSASIWIDDTKKTVSDSKAARKIEEIPAHARKELKTLISSADDGEP